MNILNYGKPAKEWLDCMPIGNGRLGAMIEGGIVEETLYLDEESVWAGCPTDNNRKGAYKDVPKVRELLFAGKYDEAREFAQTNLTGYFNNYGTHLRAAELKISYDMGENTSYHRQLDMENAVAKIVSGFGDVEVTREYYSSHPDKVVCMQIAASKAKSLNLSLALSSERENIAVEAAGNELVLRGNCHDGGVKFGIHIKAVAQGGQVVADGTSLKVAGADRVVLYLDINTSFRGEMFEDISNANIAGAIAKGYGAILADHKADFSNLFNRVELEFDSNEYADVPMDKRLEDFKNGNDDIDIVAKFFQFGRYCLISSSRKGTLCTHLQGIWNDNKAALMGWTCDYHLDINTQMNHWHAESTNIAECHEPVVTLLKSLIEPGRITAKEHYGAKGWVTHVTANVWGFTVPGFQERWGIFPTGGLWLALHLIDQYRYREDVKFLAETAYPILRESGEFFESFLVEEPNTGYLVTCPACSEENIYQDPKGGGKASVSAGPTCDNTMVRELFTFLIEASERLGVDEDKREAWQNIIDKLPPFAVGKHGQIQEWLYDFDEPEPEHRHISHLIGAFPLSQITTEQTPELAEAVRATLKRKMNIPNWESGGWSRAWYINLFARLKDEEMAYENVKGLLQYTMSSLVNFHPPMAGAVENIYEMDGNTGGTSGITEMLMQSYDGSIYILPALPKEWKTGAVRGLRARGGFELSIAWKDGSLTELGIKSLLGNACSVNYDGRNVKFSTDKGESYKLTPDLTIA